MKLYIYNGKGFFIGATVIVSAGDLSEAEAIISEELESSGLPFEGKVEVVDTRKTKVIYFDDGNY